MSAPHRDQVKAAVEQYGSMPRRDLPSWLRDPRTEYEFFIAMAVATASQPGVHPTYDADGFLDGFQGIRLREGGAR